MKLRQVTKDWDLCFIWWITGSCGRGWCDPNLQVDGQLHLVPLPQFSCFPGHSEWGERPSLSGLFLTWTLPRLCWPEPSVIWFWPFPYQPCSPWCFDRERGSCVPRARTCGAVQGAETIPLPILSTSIWMTGFHTIVSLGLIMSFFFYKWEIEASKVGSIRARNLVSCLPAQGCFPPLAAPT